MVCWFGGLGWLQEIEMKLGPRSMDELETRPSVVNAKQLQQLSLVVTSLTVYRQLWNISIISVQVRHVCEMFRKFRFKNY